MDDGAEVIRVGVVQNLESNAMLIGLYLNRKGSYERIFNNVEVI